MRSSFPLVWRIVLASFLMWAGGTTATTALEYCVTCNGPDATYRCDIAGAPQGRAQTGAQIRCISEIAKSGPHQSCSISRNHSGPCEGELRTITLETAAPSGITGPASAPSSQETAIPPDAIATPPGTLIAPTLVPAPPPPDAPQQATLPPADEVPGEPVKDDSGNPIGDAARAAGQSIDNAGQAVGNAAKKSWDCVASLFRGC